MLSRRLYLAPGRNIPETEHPVRTSAGDPSPIGRKSGAKRLAARMALQPSPGPMDEIQQPDRAVLHGNGGQLTVRGDVGFKRSATIMKGDRIIGITTIGPPQQIPPLP